MSDPVKANIIKSGAALWYAPEGEALPDETTVAAEADWGGNWQRIGYTNAPVSQTYADERMAIKVQELLGKLDEWRISEEAMMETVLAELTADYISLMTDTTPSTTVAAAGQVGYEELDIGGEGKVEVYAIGFEGIRYDDNDNKLPVRYFYPRATFKLNGATEWSKVTDSYVNVPLLITGLADPDNSGRIIKMQRVTAPATS